MSKKILFNWLVVLLWLGMIFYFSHQPDLKSELEPSWDLIFRKVAHMAEYFVLAYLLFRALSESRLSRSRLLLISFFLSLVYSGLDEWHQSFIAGRVASVVDVGIDSAGAAVFWLLSVWPDKR